MPAFIFNIGSAVNGHDKALTRRDVAHALYLVGFADAEVIKEEMSNTETTYVVLASNFRDWAGTGHEQAVWAVCEALEQDAIAYKVMYNSGSYVGFLVGPKAEDWGGEFNEDYFINL